MVDDPGWRGQDPAPQFVPEIVATFPVKEMHMRLAELFISRRPRTFPLILVINWAVPPVVIVPEQLVANAAPHQRNETIAPISHFRIMPVSPASKEFVP